MGNKPPSLPPGSRPRSTPTQRRAPRPRRPRRPHSPGQRRSAAEDAVPRLVNRASLRSNETARHGGIDGPRVLSPSPPPSPPPSKHGAAGGAHRGGSRSHEAGLLPTPPASNAQCSGSTGAARRSRTCEHADSGRSPEGLQLQRRDGCGAPPEDSAPAPVPPGCAAPWAVQRCLPAPFSRPRDGHAPLTGSVLRAVSGVRGVPAGQPPGCRAGGGCRSSAGCVSRASCRSRM